MKNNYIVYVALVSMLLLTGCGNFIQNYYHQTSTEYGVAFLVNLTINRTDTGSASNGAVAIYMPYGWQVDFEKSIAYNDQGTWRPTLISDNGTAISSGSYTSCAEYYEPIRDGYTWYWIGNDTMIEAQGDYATVVELWIIPNSAGNISDLNYFILADNTGYPPTTIRDGICNLTIEIEPRNYIFYDDGLTDNASNSISIDDYVTSHYWKLISGGDGCQYKNESGNQIINCSSGTYLVAQYGRNTTFEFAMKIYNLDALVMGFYGTTSWSMNGADLEMYNGDCTPDTVAITPQSDWHTYKIVREQDPNSLSNDYVTIYVDDVNSSTCYKSNEDSWVLDGTDYVAFDNILHYCTDGVACYPVAEEETPPSETYYPWGTPVMNVTTGTSTYYNLTLNISDVERAIGYEWYENGTLKQNSSSITYTTEWIAYSDYRYQVRAYNGTYYGNYSANYTYTLLELVPPTYYPIGTPTLNVTNGTSSYFNLTLEVSGVDAAAGYEWYENGAIKQNSSSTSYTTQRTQPNGYLIKVVPYNGTYYGTSGTYQYYILTDFTPTGTPTISPGSGTYTTNQTLTISGMTGAAGYEWRQNSTLVQNSSSAAYNTTWSTTGVFQIYAVPYNGTFYGVQSANYLYNYAPTEPAPPSEPSAYTPTGNFVLDTVMWGQGENPSRLIAIIAFVGIIAMAATIIGKNIKSGKTK